MPVHELWRCPRKWLILLTRKSTFVQKSFNSLKFRNYAKVRNYNVVAVHTFRRLDSVRFCARAHAQHGHRHTATRNGLDMPH